jgi:hypothetical protein
MNLRTLISLVGVSLASTAGAQAPSDAVALPASLGSQGSILIQPGTDQVLMGVTDDNFAVYQEGQTLYATALVPGARRHFIAEVPAGNVAQILQVGNVVMAWPNPDRTLPGFGVSPLVIWSALGGAHRISENSAVALVATDTGPFNLQVLYTTNTTPDGLVGDLAIVDVFSALPPRTLLTQIRLDFPFGQCRPLAAFIGPPGRGVPTAEYCAGKDTTATLSRWVLGKRKDLINGIVTPLPFVLQTNEHGTEFFVRLAGTGNPVVVTDQGKTRIVDNVSSTTGVIAGEDTVVYTSQTTAGRELRLAVPGKGPITAAPKVLGLFASRYNYGGFSRRPAPSPDQRLVLYGTQLDPTGNFTDLQMLDVRTGASVTLDGLSETSQADEIFTADSTHALWWGPINRRTFQGALQAGDRTGAVRQVSEDDTVINTLAATGSVVSYNDHITFDSNPFGTFLLSNGDIHVADVNRPDATRRLIATQAHQVYFPSHHRLGLVYTTDATGVAPGLYLASARP